ncbi:hypothetical protein ACJX0J_025681, partial [Zea mays]
SILCRVNSILKPNCVFTFLYRFILFFCCIFISIELLWSNYVEFFMLQKKYFYVDLL